MNNRMKENCFNVGKGTNFWFTAQERRGCGARAEGERLS